MATFSIQIKMRVNAYTVGPGGGSGNQLWWRLYASYNNNDPAIGGIRFYMDGNGTEEIRVHGVAWTSAYTLGQWYTFKISFTEDAAGVIERYYVDGDEKYSRNHPTYTTFPGTMYARLAAYAQISSSPYDWNLDADADDFESTVDGTLDYTDDFADGDFYPWTYTNKQPEDVNPETLFALVETGGLCHADDSDTVADTWFGLLYKDVYPARRYRNHHLVRDWKTNRIFKVYAR